MKLFMSIAFFLVLVCLVIGCESSRPHAATLDPAILHIVWQSAPNTSGTIAPEFAARETAWQIYQTDYIDSVPDTDTEFSTREMWCERKGNTQSLCVSLPLRARFESDKSGRLTRVTVTCTDPIATDPLAAEPSRNRARERFDTHTAALKSAVTLVVERAGLSLTNLHSEQKATWEEGWQSALQSPTRH